MEELMSLTQSGLTGRDYKNGERAFGAARCVVCHRFVGQGGATGPDLTQAAGRFQLKDLVEAIVEPSKVISDQYRATQIVTDGGQVIVGRLLSETDSQVTILVDPENSSKVREIPREEIDSLQPSKVSLMPAELINSLNQNEVLDLLAYLLSRGDATSPMFKK
jgi:putative heme-binding domain-containing protein